MKKADVHSCNEWEGCYGCKKSPTNKYLLSSTENDNDELVSKHKTGQYDFALPINNNFISVLSVSSTVCIAN